MRAGRMKDYEGLHQDHEHEDLVTRHHCTDVPWCVAFALALLGFAGVYAGATGGDLRKLYHGIDYQGTVCGVDKGAEHKPYVFWCISPTSLDGVSIDLDLGKPICVKSCPSKRSSWGGAGDSGATEGCANATGSLAPAEYPTTLVLQRYCLPELDRHASDVVQRLGQGGTTWMRDASSIASAWPALLGSFLMAFAFGYIYFLLLKHVARHVLLGTIAVSIVISFVMGIHLLGFSGPHVSASGEPLPAGLGHHRATLSRLLGVDCLLLSGVLAFTLCCFNSSILVAASCIEMACEVIFDLPSLLLVPALKAFAKGILSLVLLFGFLLLQASAELKVGANGGPPVLGSDQWPKTMFYMLVAFWLLAFTNALFQFAVAYATAEYYYAPYDENNRKAVGIWSVWAGISVGLVYHSGSLALGSLLVAALKVFQKALKQADQKQPCEAIHLILECCKCFVCCCEEFVKVVNEVAYVDIAINSDNFCSAAKRALEAMTEVGGHMLVLSGAVHAFTFFGSISITGMSAVVTYIAVSHGVFVDNGSDFLVENPYLPTLVSAGIALLVALAFVHVFDMTSDTLLYCYGLDLQHGEPALTAPPALRRLVIGRGGSEKKARRPK